jgi:membrane-bound metal-dependent hydrolase YbcI (DUF457 family)
MANYQGHLLGGLGAFGATLMIHEHYAHHATHPASHIIFWLMLCLFGSLFPDIDIHSMGQKILYKLLLLTLALCTFFGFWQALPFLTLAALFPQCVKHRGLTHNILFILLAPLPAPLAISLWHRSYTIFAYTSYLFFVAGALSHLLLDYGIIGLIKKCIPRAYTGKKRRFK